MVCRSVTIVSQSLILRVNYVTECHVVANMLRSRAILRCTA